LRNISQSKKCKGAGAKKYRAGTGIKGYGKREVQTPLSPPTYVTESFDLHVNKTNGHFISERCDKNHFCEEMEYLEHGRRAI